MAKNKDIEKQLDTLFNEEEDGDEGEEITEADILKMKKGELADFIEDEGLDIDDDVKDGKVGPLRKAVADAFFADEVDDDDDDDDDDDGDDDSGDLTEEAIMGMTLAQLRDVRKENDLDIPKAQTRKKADFQAAIIEAMNLSDTEGEDEDEDEVDLSDMGKKDLLAYIKENDLEVKGAKKMKAKELRAAIEEAQEEDEPEEEEEDDDTLTYADVMEMSKSDLDEIVEEEELSVKKKVRKNLNRYRKAVAAELDLEEEEEEEDEPEEKPKRSSRASGGKRKSIVDTAAEYPKKKGKVTKANPFKEGTKRYHGAKVLMEKARTGVDHQERASKTHKKAKVAGSNDYKTLIDPNFVGNIIGKQYGGVYEVDEEDDTLVLLGFGKAKK